MNITTEIRKLWRAIRDIETLCLRIPSRMNSTAGGAGGGSGPEPGSYIPLYRADSIPELEEGADIEHYAKGFIEKGEMAGAWLGRNKSNSGWVGENFWEVTEEEP